ncbi:hypothetical protein CONPUDRAFT_114267 [Coniophora puteana RWD-64-598 SS2]|uniref:E3 ubiquitin-protein ligase PEP5 n=1 Tax=Coniophora puteana (strain RWD-64-598) TaxID=741705 RepID=A0A5M3N3Y1_CONPW|nr:uncharacterized protein CONPUDRAFT_114267 [Coniophora puteana RWD-64-598 SS2]EIW86132.1 hypothetical protein CONPUDRAFT_114267 [Coniophora puteana RWD-64-598 SS2]
MAAPPSASAGASAEALRTFSFFDLERVSDVHDLANSPEILRNATDISTVVSSAAGLLVADTHGSIHLLKPDFSPITSWIAHVNGRVTHMVERDGILITVGDEDGVRASLLKVWELAKIDQRTGAPNLLRSTKVQPGNRPHPVSSIALSSSMSYLALGFGDGTVLLYRHLDQSLFSSSSSLSALPKPRTIHESPTDPITGLGFREPDPIHDTAATVNGSGAVGTGTGASPNLHLFIVTTGGVWACHVSGRGSGGASAIVDEVGCGLGCATMDWYRRNVVIARDESIYSCGIQGRENSYAYEGQKTLITPHLNYIIVVTPPSPPPRGLSARQDNISESTRVTVVDLENKIAAYSGTFSEGVREVFSAWGHIYVLANDGQLSSLKEKPTTEKLSMLYQRSLYPLALDVARTQRLDASHVADIHRQYGDYLYLKGDFDGAMHEFVQTIGQLQPSYVIRKFLDAQRIHNLTTYLQELHTLGLANADHTTLLLNTYTKLKDASRLDAFIKSEVRRSSAKEGGGGGGRGDGEEELPFDLDTVIRVCRQAGYYEHAAYLARKYERHEDYLRVQIEDAGNFGEALVYLRRLGAEAAESNLARYGRAMLNSLPEETTQLLIDLCTVSGPLVPAEEDEKTSGPTRQQTTGASYLAYLALKGPAAAPATTVGDDTAVPPSPSAKTVQAKLSDSPTQTAEPSRTSTPVPGGNAPAPAAPAPPPPRAKRPSPCLYFAHFVDHTAYFITFLETVAHRRWGQSVDAPSISATATVSPSTSTMVMADADGTAAAADEDVERRDQVAVWNTLLELYLDIPAALADSGGGGGGADTDAQGGAGAREKALRVLQSASLPYDPTHALILCTSARFTPGLVLLWERAGMHEDVLRFWIDRHNAGGDDANGHASAEVVRALEAYGAERPGLYALVLRFLTSSAELLTRHKADVERILEHIERERIMPPLGVVQVLSRNGVASVGLVKEWLLRRIKQSREEINTDQQLINSYRLETKTKQRQVEELSDPEHPKVFHVTKCSSCNGQLDLPSIHFMCNHSYHQRCLFGHDNECPTCAKQHEVVQEIRRNNERLADQHELFLSEVRENGFQAVAAGYGRGLLNLTRLDDVSTM